MNKQNTLENRVKNLYSGYAQEEINEVYLPYGDTSYFAIFASELACLRLYKKFICKEAFDKYHYGYSESRKSYYFSVDNNKLACIDIE